MGDKEGIGNGWAFRIMAEVRMFLVVVVAVSLSVVFNDLVIVLVTGVLSIVGFVCVGGR